MFMDGLPVARVLQHGRASLAPVKYRCGVVVNYNSDTFSGGPNATKRTNPELDGTKPMPDRPARCFPAQTEGHRHVEVLHLIRFI
jgi:hypothetical protein